MTQELNDIIGQKNLYGNDAPSSLSDRLSFSGHPSSLSSGNQPTNFTGAPPGTATGAGNNSSSGGGGMSRAPVRNLGMDSARTGNASPVLLSSTDTSSAGADSDNHRRSPSSNSSPSSSSSNNTGRQTNGGAGTPEEEDEAGEGGKRKKGSALRRGKWTLEEENYANRLISEFKVLHELKHERWHIRYDSRISSSVFKQRRPELQKCSLYFACCSRC